MTQRFNVLMVAFKTIILIKTIKTVILIKTIINSLSHFLKAEKII